MAADDVVRLRPVEERDLDQLSRIDSDPALSAPFEWRGFRDPHARRRRWAQDGYLGDADSMLVVETVEEQAFAGLVIWRSVATSGSSGCLEIGILLFPDFRGRGLGTAAQCALAAYLFLHTTVHRLEATTELDNMAEQRALEKAGFTREGLLRGRGFVRGVWQDGYIYGRLRTDPAPC